MTDDDTVRAAAAAIAATLNTALADPAARSIALNRDEALLTLGLVEAAVDALPKGDGGGTSGGMEERVARLEVHMEHANKSLDRLVHMPAELARLQERVAHLPSKGFIVTATSASVTLIGAIVLFADKIRALVAG